MHANTIRIAEDTLKLGWPKIPLISSNLAPYSINALHHTYIHITWRLAITISHHT